MAIGTNAAGTTALLERSEAARPLELPLHFNGHSYQATICTSDDRWTVDLRDESGSTVPASGDFAATLLALEQ